MNTKVIFLIKLTGAVTYDMTTRRDSYFQIATFYLIASLPCQLNAVIQISGSNHMYTAKKQL